MNSASRRAIAIAGTGTRRKEKREAGWYTEAVLGLVIRAEVWEKDTVRVALAELRRLADEDPDPTTGGAILRICDALEGVCEDR